MSNIVKHEGFGAVEEYVVTDRAAVAIAKQAEAAVQARYVMAERHPRDMDGVRIKLLKACKRPGFADAASWTIPLGGKDIVGLSVRFAEEIARDMGNILVEQITIYEDERARVVRVVVTDLEVNLTVHRDITVGKTLERKKLRKGDVAISARETSTGGRVYLIHASDMEVAKLEQSQAARARRTLLLQMLPADIKEECEAQIVETNAADSVADPSAAIKRIADAFSGIGVSPERLAEYLGHSVAENSPAETERLRGIYSAISQGEATWGDFVRDEEPAPTPRGDRMAGAIEDLAARAATVTRREPVSAPIMEDPPRVTHLHTDEQRDEMLGATPTQAPPVGAGTPGSPPPLETKYNVGMISDYTNKLYAVADKLQLAHEVVDKILKDDDLGDGHVIKEEVFGELVRHLGEMAAEMEAAEPAPEPKRSKRTRKWYQDLVRYHGYAEDTIDGLLKTKGLDRYCEMSNKDIKALFAELKMTTPDDEPPLQTDEDAPQTPATAHPRWLTRLLDAARLRGVSEDEVMGLLARYEIDPATPGKDLAPNAADVLLAEIQALAAGRVK